MGELLDLTAKLALASSEADSFVEATNPMPPATTDLDILRMIARDPSWSRAELLAPLDNQRLQAKLDRVVNTPQI